MEQRAYLIHALSPLHPGTGQSVGHIDLPVARYKATGIPYLPGSSIKGVLRDSALIKALPDVERRVIFGPEWGKSDDKSNAGALSFGDAWLLLLPVRSLRGTFAFVTSPMLLRYARRDLAGCPAVPSFPKDTRAVVAQGAVTIHNNKLFLEDLALPAAHDAKGLASQWADLLAALLFKGEETVLAERFAVVDDEAMTFLWETATQVDARVRIDDKTGVVSDGALWYEESLPAETVLVGLGSAEAPRGADAKVLASAKAVLDKVLSATNDALQFGGKATVGRGRARLIPQLPTAQGAKP